jgi:hypothetical protein
MFSRSRVRRTAATALVAGTTMVGTTRGRGTLPAGVTVTVTAGVLAGTGDQTANTLVVGQNPAQLVTLNGTPVLNWTVPRAAIIRVHMDGGAGNDSLRFDETNGTMPPGGFIGATAPTNSSAGPARTPWTASPEPTISPAWSATTT